MNSGLVSIIGRPNAGKSTFLNAILGEKIAAVSPKPQTTRNRIMGVHNNTRGQIVFIDTPGVHKPHNKMHKRMVDIAMASTNDIDVLLLMVDAATQYGKGDEYLIRHLKNLEETTIVVALNKIDILSKEKLLPLMETYQNELNPAAIVPISAKDRQGIEHLEAELFKALPEGEPLYPAETLTDQTERQFVAEIIREKVFLNTRREIPFCTAVIIDQFEESESLLTIAASIVVERKGQKGIVIGKGASMLKTIGTSARKELEKVLATKIHLDLFVKVKEQWRENERLLDELGIE